MCCFSTEKTILWKKYHYMIFCEQILSYLQSSEFYSRLQCLFAPFLRTWIIQLTSILHVHLKKSCTVKTSLSFCSRKAIKISHLTSAEMNNVLHFPPKKIDNCSQDACLYATDMPRTAKPHRLLLVSAQAGCAVGHRSTIAIRETQPSHKLIQYLLITEPALEANEHQRSDYTAGDLKYSYKECWGKD